MFVIIVVRAAYGAERARACSVKGAQTAFMRSAGPFPGQYVVNMSEESHKTFKLEK